MRLTSAFLLFITALETFCGASPHLLASTGSLIHGRRSTFTDSVSVHSNAAELDDLARRSGLKGRSSTPAGYSTDGRCGPKIGGLMCDPNSTVYIGTCCSSEGWCGSTAEFCGDGCVSGCFNRATTDQRDSAVVGRCGPNFGGKQCDAKGPYGGCCGSEGWCGLTSLYCELSEGCLSGCNGSTTSQATRTTTKSTLRMAASSSTSPSTVWSSSSTLRRSVSPITAVERSSSEGFASTTKAPQSSSFSVRRSPMKEENSSTSILTKQTSAVTNTRLSNRSIAASTTSSSSSQFKASLASTSVKIGISSSSDPPPKVVPQSPRPQSSINPPSPSLSSISLSSFTTTIKSPSWFLTSSKVFGPGIPESTTSISPSSQMSGSVIIHSQTSLESTQSNSFVSVSSSTNTFHSSSALQTASTMINLPLIITIDGVAYTAIAQNTALVGGSTASVTKTSGTSLMSNESTKVLASRSASQSLQAFTTPSITLSSPANNASSSSILSVSSILPSSGTSTSSGSFVGSTEPPSTSLNIAATPAISRNSASFTPSNAAQAACANPFETFPNGTNGVGLTVECFITLDVVGYLKNWIATNYPKVCSDTQDFSTCFEEYLGIYDAGTDCTGIKTASCTGFKYSAYAHLNWDVREIYILQSIYGINQFFASWYNGLLGAQSGAALTIGAIVNRLNPPKTTNVLLNDILAALSLGLSTFTLPDAIVKAVQGLEMLEDAIRATPGFVRAFTPEKTSNDQLQIGDIQAQLGAVVAQFLTQISNATAAIETNATAFTTWASTGLFLGNLVFLDDMVQDNYRYLNTFVLGQALNANNIVATVGLNTNVAQLQANSSDSLSYDIKCPGYDNNTMCNGWWYDAAEDASFALDNIKSMSKNMQDDLSYFFNSGWTNGTLLFDGALKCQQSGGGDPALNFSPGTSLGAMAQCFSSVKLCTWNLGCDLDSQCEFKDCPLQSGFGVNGCGDNDAVIYDFNVPYNYLGTFLTDANPSSEVCNNGP